MNSFVSDRYIWDNTQSLKEIQETSILIFIVIVVYVLLAKLTK